MPAPPEPPHPPPDPHPSRVSGLSLGTAAGDEGPGRLQLGAALLLGLVLVAAGLYMWRRPRSADPSADDTSAASPAASSGLSAAGIVIGAVSPEAGSPSGVALTEPRVLACQDKGSKKTAPDACDRLAPVEKALADAINHSATCVQSGSGSAAGGGTIEYVADVSFSRHKVGVILPRAGRSVSDRKALHSCATA